MNVEALMPTTGPSTQRSTVVAEKVDKARNVKESAPENLGSASEAGKEIQPEELLKQIKSITEDGLYSVQFENNDENKTIVKVIDRETNEVIRQIPPEELLELTKHLNELQGNIVDTVG
ncbi:flagellar protein FlaG [Desulfopila sp. IMCC35008]|uniref:flagellar protein FlaG n=1 Tax=Desulfopila sp. IMCC35008 TaxID=2653858 RepID=UPI0013D61DAF|nr:flagellar protein FlaG [Desulfopila sp. IMCC35008]